MNCANVIAIQNQNHAPSSTFNLACKGLVARTISSLFNFIAPTNALPLSKSGKFSGASNLDTTPHVSM